MNAISDVQKRFPKIHRIARDRFFFLEFLRASTLQWLAEGLRPPIGGQEKREEQKSNTHTQRRMWRGVLVLVLTALLCSQPSLARARPPVRPVQVRKTHTHKKKKEKEEKKKKKRREKMLFGRKGVCGRGASTALSVRGRDLASSLCSTRQKHKRKKKKKKKRKEKKKGEKTSLFESLDRLKTRQKLFFFFFERKKKKCFEDLIV